MSVLDDNGLSVSRQLTTCFSCAQSGESRRRNAHSFVVRLVPVLHQANFVHMKTKPPNSIQPATTPNHAPPPFSPTGGVGETQEHGRAVRDEDLEEGGRGSEAAGGAD